jgi:hypothetical protein
MKSLEEAIDAVVAGDIKFFSLVRAANHTDLQVAAAKLSPLSVSRAALINVLNEWRRGQCVAEDVQQWASFVRRGYVAGSTTDSGLYPIDIEYDTRDEELIAEIIGRFDELGDIIDGEIDEMERKEMLSVLLK